MGLWKKITGLEKLEKAREAEEERLAKLEEEVIAEEKAREQRRKEEDEENRRREEELKRIQEEEELAKLSPKERATKKGEAWVQVLDTHVNENDIRNGFFELDWNQQFVDELVQAGYGTEADPEEEVVDRWFRDIVSQMLVEDGMDPNSRGSGYINVSNLGDGKSEVS